MNIIQKHHIDFIDMEGMSITTKIGVKLFLLKSILKIELLYYRNTSEIIRLVINSFLISLLIFMSSQLQEIMYIQIWGLLVLWNLDILYLLLHPNVPIIEDKDKTKLLHLSADLNEEDNTLVLKGMHKNKIIFFIKNSSMDPKLLMPLLNEYIESKNLAKYKQEFLKNNIEIEFLEGEEPSVASV